MNHLSFMPAKYRQRRLLALRQHAVDGVPDRRGVYVLVAASGVQFRYPKGRSAVFYIGQASRLRKRLLQHLKYTTEARKARRRSRYWPRYEYAAAFGARYAVILCPRGRSARSFEGQMIRAFADKFRAHPVANAQ